MAKGTLIASRSGIVEKYYMMDVLVTLELGFLKKPVTKKKNVGEIMFASVVDIVFCDCCR